VLDCNSNENARGRGRGRGRGIVMYAGKTRSIRERHTDRKKLGERERKRERLKEGRSRKRVMQRKFDE